MPSTGRQRDPEGAWRPEAREERRQLVGEVRKIACPPHSSSSARCRTLRPARGARGKTLRQFELKRQ